MFILYSLLVGVPLGFLLGGRASGLSALQIRWPWAMTAGLLVQLAIFSTPLNDRVGDWGPLVYVASTFVVVAAIAVNWRITGMPIIALGAMSNLVAIVANGGYMPADPGAMASLGRTEIVGYSNSALLMAPKLKPLTDIFALPTWVPFTNVFSVGDAIIGLGVAVVIVAAMRSSPRPAERAVAMSDGADDPAPMADAGPA